MQRLYDRPEIYDAEMDEFTDDLDFYREISTACGPRVLELGCGTGRISVPMALSGAIVTGVDINPAMLKVARQRAERANAQIDFIVANMQTASVDPSFDLVIIPSNTLQHLLVFDHLLTGLRNAGHHMKSGGRLAFDLATPFIKMLNYDAEHRHNSRSLADPVTGNRLIRYQTNAYDSATQILDVNWHYEDRQTGDEFVTTFKQRQIFPQELLVLLKLSGLKILARYGDFSKGSFTSTSLKQIVVCERVESGKS